MKTLMLLLMLVGCAQTATTDVVDPIVAQCRQDAADTCGRLGYGDNETCLLTFSQGCSADDEAAAHACCLAATGDDSCVMEWR